jgi:hypothetical protein
VIISEAQAADGTYGADFTCDEALVVVSMAPGGLAESAGAGLGWRLVGFQRRRLAAETTLSALRAAASSRAEAFPHYLTFADVDSAAGAAACAAYSAAEEARQRRNEEIVAALGVLTQVQAFPCVRGPS